MIQDFKQWAEPHVETNSFSDLSGTVLGIEASFYVSYLLDTSRKIHEGLLCATGGIGNGFAHHFNIHLDILQHYNITPVFVFSGLETGKQYEPFRDSRETARAVSEGWEIYHKTDTAQDAVTSFSKSGWAKPEMFYRLLQTVLVERGIEFIVAPYDSAAQLAYLIKEEPAYIDAVAGPQELLLYDVKTVIVDMNFEYKESAPLNPEVAYDAATFTWVTLQSCVDDLALHSQERFVDACMLGGCQYLPSLPTLADVSRLPSGTNRLRQAAGYISKDGFNGTSTGIDVIMRMMDNTLDGSANIETSKKEDYLDRFRRARLAVKHQIVLGKDGKVEPFAPDKIPNDLNEIIGQRLPEELYYYLSIALIAPRPLNQLTSGQIYELIPVAGGESLDYQQLVKDKLIPLRASTLALLCSPLHRGFQYRDIVVNCWFDPETQTPVAIRTLQEPLRATINKWNVHADLLPQTAKEMSLAYAVQSLTSTLAGKTVSGKNPTQLLNKDIEIRANTLWRFLHIREYINDKHELTSWGKVLNAALSAGESNSEVDDAVLTAIEALRFGILTSKDMFERYTGKPYRGSATDRRNALLVSRVASLLHLAHQPSGWHGPLSRHMHAFTTMINVVRTSLRDLLEVTLTTLLLNGDADRDTLLNENGKTLTNVSLTLPLLFPCDATLGIAMKEYLDSRELTAVPEEEITEERKAKAIQLASTEWFKAATDLKGDLNKAWKLWDKVNEGVKVAVQEGLVKEGDMWKECHEWTQKRR